MKFVMWSIRTFNVRLPPRFGNADLEVYAPRPRPKAKWNPQSSSLSYAPPGDTAPSQHNQWSILPTLREPRDPWPDYLRGKFSAPQRVLPRLSLVTRTEWSVRAWVLHCSAVRAWPISSSSLLLKKLKTSMAPNLTERDDQNNKDVTIVQSNTATEYH